MGDIFQNPDAANGHGNGKPEHIEDRLFINGEFVPSIGGKKFDVESPYTEQKFASVYEAMPEDVDKAVEAAEAAFPAWSEMGAIARGSYFYKLATLLESAGPELSYLEANEIGKPVAQYCGSSTSVTSMQVDLVLTLHSRARCWRTALSNVCWPSS